MGLTRYFEDFAIGDTVVSRSRRLETADMRLFSACTNLCARIHSDPVYCEKIDELGAITVPYSLVLNVVDGFFAQSVSPDGVATFHYGYDEVRYGAKVFPGDVIQSEFCLTGKQVKNDEFGVLQFDVTTRNQRGEVVVSHVDKLYCGRRLQGSSQV